MTERAEIRPDDTREAISAGRRRFGPHTRRRNWWLRLPRGLGLSRHYQTSNQLVLQSRSENQELTSQIADEGAKLAALQVELKSVQDALDAIMPAQNTYSFSPNQSMIVADGNLTIGLIGSPANEGVNININGKMHSAAAGGAIKIPLDPSTTCQVVVRSFDMFKAVLTASCAAVKPQ